MNAVPILIIVALALIFAKEIRGRLNNSKSKKYYDSKEFREHLHHMQDKLKWIISKRLEKNTRHVWLTEQDPAKFTSDELKIFQYKLIQALKAYPGEADELLEANKESAKNAKESKQRRALRHQAHKGKSHAQVAKPIDPTRW